MAVEKTILDINRPYVVVSDKRSWKFRCIDAAVVLLPTGW